METQTKSPFFFTYGTDDNIMPFVGGWSVIYAETRNEAINKHHKKHGFTKDGFGRYAGDYDEEEFKKTNMRNNGNLGGFLQELIF